MEEEGEEGRLARSRGGIIGGVVSWEGSGGVVGGVWGVGLVVVVIMVVVVVGLWWWVWWCVCHGERGMAGVGGRCITLRSLYDGNC